MGISVFDFQDYKAYLNANLSERPHRGRGERSKLATTLRCNTTYVSQVLNGSIHFSLEQAERANRFLNHSREESHFFLLLVQFCRAGTPELRHYFGSQIQQVHEHRQILKNRLDFKKTISTEDQTTYYSAWYFIAVHLLITMPEFQTAKRLSEHLSLPTTRIHEILEALMKCGLAIRDGDRYKTGPFSIHLGTDSSVLAKHHANWRMQAIQDLDRGAKPNHMHYSSVVTIAEKDIPKVRSIMVSAIEAVRKVVKESKEDRLYCYTLDLFEVGGNNSG